MVNKQKKLKPPRLLRGMFAAIFVITATILLLAWAIINYQIEQLVATRTSEYAHSIAQIAANSSADALLSDDKLQLKMLVENVAKDPYIRSATVFAEDGQIVAQYPEEQLHDNESELDGASNGPTNNSEVSQVGETTESGDSALTANLAEQALSPAAQAYIQSQNDIPFIEKIVYQDVTAGWFKVSLNRELLESSFRQSMKRSQHLILFITLVLFVVLLLVVYRFEKRIKSLIKTCHRLLTVNAPSMPQDQKQWLSSLKELSETRFQALAEHTQLPGEQKNWVSSSRKTNTLFCYLQFAMLEQENEKTADCITLAENYLQSAIQTHGVQSQGDILSGCLIPFLECEDVSEGIGESLALVHTISELLASIELVITVRAFVGMGTLLVLENERGLISGVSLSNRLHDKINQCAPLTKFGETICLALDDKELAQLGDFEPLVIPENSTSSPVFKLKSLNESIKQQTNRQISYIISNN